MAMMLLGCAALVSVTAGTADDVILDTSDIPEEGFQLGRLCLTATGGNLARAFIPPAGGIIFAGDQLTQGYVPAVLFGRDALGSPRFGHLVKRNQNLKVWCDGDANVEVGAVFTNSSGPTNEDLRPGKSIVAIGQDTAPASLAAGASITLTITPDESGRIGRMIAQDVGANALEEELFITRIAINGREVSRGTIPFSQLRHDAVASPWLDEVVEAGVTKISVTVTNGHASNAAKPCLALIVVE